MNGKFRLLVLTPLLAITTFGQSPRPAATTNTSATTIAVGGGAMGGGIGWSVIGPGGPTVTGMPYSADQTSEQVQTLADGTRITHNSTNHVYRDSQGRTRTERSMPTAGPVGAETLVLIDITDPVAHVHYMLDSQQKVAHKNALPDLEHMRTEPRTFAAAGTLSNVSPPPPPVKVRRPSNGERPETSFEKLGSQTMEGLMVEGTRHSMTWPAGSPMGNDRPLITTIETWTSPELKITVLSKQTDPRNGDHTERLTNISRTEPDPSMFLPPADYTIQEDGPPPPPR